MAAIFGIVAQGERVAMQTSDRIDTLMAWARSNLKPNGAILRIVNIDTGQGGLTGKAGSGWAHNADAVWGGAPYDYPW